MLLLFHLACTVVFGYALYYDLYIIKFPPEMSDRIAFGGRWKYLTVWDMVLQLMFHFICLLNDTFNGSEKKLQKWPGLQRVRDFMFAALAFPLGIFVSVTFWGLYAVDRNLIMPPIFDTFYPSWLNQSVHSLPMAGMILESVMSFHLYPSRQRGFLAAASLVLVYLTWVLYIAHAGGIWVYPVLQVLNMWQRTVFIVACIMVVVCVYLLGESLNKMIWRKVLEQHLRLSQKIGTEDEKKRS